MAKNGILAKSNALQQSFLATNEQVTIGIDLGDRFSHCDTASHERRLLKCEWKHGESVHHDISVTLRCDDLGITARSSEPAGAYCLSLAPAQELALRLGLRLRLPAEHFQPID
jgi:hypothetical protein